MNWYNGSVEDFRKAYNLDPLAQRIEELERWMAGLQVQHDALTVRATALDGGMTYLETQRKAQAASILALQAADEQVKSRVMSAETAIDLVATKAANNRTWLQNLDAWAKGIALK